MQTYRLLCSWLALFGVTVSAHGQGTFRNWDFESAKVAGVLLGVVPITNALPGWAGYINGNPVDQVLYNTSSLGGSSVSLMDPFTPAPSLRPIQGSYSVYL